MTKKVSHRSHAWRARKPLLPKIRAKTAREIQQRRAHQEREQLARDPNHLPRREYVE